MISKLGMDMKDPDVVEVLEELEERCRIVASLPAGYERSREQDRYNGERRKLQMIGSYQYAIFIECRNPESKIKAQIRTANAAGTSIVEELFGNSINGKHGYHVEVGPLGESHDSQLLFDAFWGREKTYKGRSGLNVQRELGVNLNIQWGATSSPVVVHAFIPQPYNYKFIEKNEEEFKARFEKAHQVLKFWKYCVEWDYDRGITLVTVKEAYDLFLQEDSKLKRRWVKESGVLEKASAVKGDAIEE